MRGNTFFSQLFQFATRPVFLFVDVSGLIFLIISQWLPPMWSAGSLTVGSTLITIGITLPIALFYQLKSNAEAFKILDTCTRSGIQSIFISRKTDYDDLRRSINNAIIGTNEISLLGIAFRSFFNPSAEHTDQVRERITSPKFLLRVLLLDPDSNAAQRRAAVEQGNATIDDIRFTLSNSSVATIQERIRRLIPKVPGLAEKLCQPNKDLNSSGFLSDIAEKINFNVRIYSTEPAVFIMKFDSCIITEQYHRGRPDKVIPFGSCIGKYVPILQYEKSSDGYKIFADYFDRLWDESQDLTIDLVKKAIETLPNDWLSGICELDQKILTKPAP